MKYFPSVIIGVLLSIFLMSNVSAHEIRPAYLKLTELEHSSSATAGSETTDAEGSMIFYRVVWKQPIRSGESLHLEPVLPENCEEVGRSLGESTSKALIKRWKIVCTGSGLQEKTIAISGLDSTMVDAFVEVVFIDGTIQTHILRPGSSTIVVDNSGNSSGSSSYLWLGIEHLLQGYDHILFIIGLVLLVRTPMNLVKVVTSFTVAHSLTLALATFGIVKLSQAPVEAVIALSIVFLAVELFHKSNSQDKNKSIMQTYPWVITFVFGLLHGFGFAGALTEIGLPEQAAMMALLLFNIGVELGQLMIVAGMLVLLAFLGMMRVILPLYLKRVPAYSIGTVAAFWFIERSLSILQVA